MDLSELNIADGSAIFHDIANLPTRGQELFFSLIESSIFDEKRESMQILDDLYNRGSLNYSECKSPIEQIFAFAYDIVIVNQGFPESELLNIYPQEEICVNNCKYFADFCFDTEKMKHVYYEHPLKLVIECDGHDYHEKTKEQVAKNNQRDLDLKMNGYDVLHFSGSQIYKNPIKCAQEVYKYIKTKVGDMWIDF